MAWLIAHSGEVTSVVRGTAQAHLALFYLTGAFYHVAKRVAGVRHVLLHATQGSRSPLNFRLLGILLAVQIVARGLSHLWRLHRERILADSPVSPPTISTGETRPESDFQCPLCLKYSGVAIICILVFNLSICLFAQPVRESHDDDMRTRFLLALHLRVLPGAATVSDLPPGRASEPIDTDVQFLIAHAYLFDVNKF